MNQQPEKRSDEDHLVVEFGPKGGRASVPPGLFRDIGPWLKWAVILFSMAGSISLILMAWSLVVRAGR
jgi:hypothetical protein